MCGIAGVVSRKPEPEVLHRMSARVRHRGPDGAGEWRGEREGWQVGLAHRRLAIIDVRGGHQPMATEDGALQLAYNGETYNFPSLRDRLVARGHEFRTHSDSEVVLQHLEDYGSDGLVALNGMFALALWNDDTGELLLARDRAGIKPLYYGSRPDGGVAFASELSALLEDPAIDRALCPEGLAGYFFLDYAHAPTSLVRGALKLPPGHYVKWKDGHLSAPTPFWTLGAVRPRQPSSGRAALASELWERLERSVRRQLVSDVPVGVFLSGGLDSSIIAALAQEISLASSGRPIRTFSIAFEDPEFDEGAHARAVAATLHTRHNEEVLTEQSVLTAVDAALGALDEPMADPSIVPTYLLSRLAARQVKVALGGDGSDELWGGYATYRAHQLARRYELLPALVRRRMLEPLIAAMPTRESYQSIEWKAKRFALRWDDDPIRRHLRWMSSTDLPDLPSALPRSPQPVFAGLEWPLFADPLNAMLALDFSTYMPGSVLAKLDRASMANGLETRPPFLDNELIDWSFSLPSSLKLHEGVGKYLLRLAARGHLGEATILRKKKGFAIPLARWLKGPLKARLQDVLSGSPAWQTGLLDKTVFDLWAKQHFDGRVDRSRPLWALIVLDSWMRRGFGG